MPAAWPRSRSEQRSFANLHRKTEPQVESTPPGHFRGSPYPGPLRPGQSRSTNLTPLPDHSPDPEAGQSIPVSRAVILCVERDPHVRDLETYFLTEAGFQVTFAADGLEAFELVRTLRPAIVITEILVPKLDGLALCRRLKADEATKGTVVLVFSLLAAQDRAREAGADAFLGKPLAAQRLTETVRKLLADSHSTPDGTP
jgi:CheY-like chemotaxis protein